MTRMDIEELTLAAWLVVYCLADAHWPVRLIAGFGLGCAVRGILLEVHRAVKERA